MSYQPINLGTPNNNDGDSLFAGGTKINANFSDIYNNLGGSTAAAIKVGIPNSFNSSTGLFWNYLQGQFIPASSNALRSLGSVGYNGLFITNNAGVAGNADNDLSSTGNSINAVLEGSTMFLLKVRNNTSIGTTKGILDINLGNQNVTSVSIYTTGTVIRGQYGLTILQALAEDNATYTKLLDASSSNTTGGITLYQSPVLDVNTLPLQNRNEIGRAHV